MQLTRKLLELKIHMNTVFWVFLVNKNQKCTQLKKTAKRHDVIFFKKGKKGRTKS